MAKAASAQCGAKLRNKDRICKNTAGFKTPHQGEGRCYLHGGLTPVRHGRYSKLNHSRLKGLLEELKQNDQDVLDLEPEAQLMRAMLIDYVNRYEDFVEQLETWYDAFNRDRAEDGLPPIPKRIPNLDDASALLESISRVVERIHKIKKDGAISLSLFRHLLQEMGVVVARHVSDETTLNNIEQDWGKLSADPRMIVNVPEEDEE